jgi:hypothetical protein
MAAKANYEVRVLGRLGPAARESFADVAIDVVPATTVMAGTWDQRGLLTFLGRLKALGFGSR